ncbi:pentapeptide repeat-containing protein, partial [Blautia sp.]
NISNANISNANISNANISNANILNANILNVNISNTNIMCKYNMRNDIGCKFLYDKILIKIYDIIGKI